MVGLFDDLFDVIVESLQCCELLLEKLCVYCGDVAVLVPLDLVARSS